MTTLTKCVILLSGGQDSTTVALQAKTCYQEVHALTIHYGQRHEIEIESALAVGKALNVTSHEVIELGNVLRSTSPLVSSNSVDTFEKPEDVPEGVANTFIPSRNALFLTLASNRAIALGISTIYTGVCECDYSGYPDCRRVFIDSLEDALSLGNFGEKGKFKILTPLMSLTKAETVKLAHNLLGTEGFKRMFELTHTCYQGVKGDADIAPPACFETKGLPKLKLMIQFGSLERLKMVEFYGSNAIARAALEPLEIWESPSIIPYLIHLEHPEFSSLCPRSGYPDSGTIVIDYIPHQFTVELKAIKLYINSFRNERISHEGVINAIADKFFKDVKPKSLRVIGDFMRRGGVKTVITVQRGESHDFARYQANTL